MGPYFKSSEGDVLTFSLSETKHKGTTADGMQLSVTQVANVSMYG